MPLAQMPLDCEVHVIADWFEFYVLKSQYEAASFSDLQRMWDRRRNTEDSAPDGRRETSRARDGDEQFLETVLTEVRERIKCLDAAYPFEFNKSGEGLRLKSDLEVGNVVYLFCLLLSSANSSEIFELDKFSYKLDNKVRDLFQACSTWAAASVTKGSAWSFGFPRPDGSNFLDKLRQIYELFGEGRVRDSPLPGVSLSLKDGGIDIIAWAHRADFAAGRLYILGQVATGGNWPNKSVVEYLIPFHHDWFSDNPSSHPTPALFIPYCIPVPEDATLQQRIHILTRQYGNVYYRYVIPRLANEGYELAKNDTNLSIDRIGDFDSIKAWVLGILDRMKQAIATA
ncbi:hypothetical protein [Nitrosospira sp. Nsp1]|uniref:hypothetical protein n=1 Tax=Nitrosospira sp. Nsp1 TaxID=136547 RepID=UPI00088E4437|nr:hypothetical protein [Nitrosospira sp. Nsp1]SCX37308.1 hypothetical protein SAMN05720354_10148 [Nitrosospira sp. Nsp1]